MQHEMDLVMVTGRASDIASDLGMALLACEFGRVLARWPLWPDATVTS